MHASDPRLNQPPLNGPMSGYQTPQSLPAEGLVPGLALQEGQGTPKS